MKYPKPLIAAKLIRRYKRFLADVCLPDGSTLTVHCPNTGSMLRCMEVDAEIWLSTSDNKQRKYRHTWEWVMVDGQYRACINPSLANRLVAEGLESGLIPGLRDRLADDGQLRTEPKVSDGRLDFCISDSSSVDEYIEVKSVTLKVSPDSKLGAFPDARTERGLKHLRRLAALVEQGYRSRLIFCVMHEGIEQVTTAAEIDPDYAEALRQVIQQGVKVEAYQAAFKQSENEAELMLVNAIPVVL